MVFKKKRIFIVADVIFPRGQAGANYVQYLALALNNANWQVIIIGNGKNNIDDLDSTSNKYLYKGIEYNNISLDEFKIPNYVMRNLVYRKLLKKKLIELSISEKDYVIFYSTNYTLYNEVLKIIPIDHVSVCWVEWLQDYQFTGGKLGPGYFAYRKAFKSIGTKIKKVMPISRILEEQFRKQGSQTLLLPIMADPFEYSLKTKFINQNNKIKFIYSGAAKNKDSFDVMLEAFLGLDRDELNKIEFHLTSMTEEKLKKLLNGKDELIEKLRDQLVLHSWMEYDELINLYFNIDYLLLAREDNITTRANFPSKVPEMMGYGIIPVCSNVGDYTSLYLTNDYDSIIFEGCDADNCREAIQKAIYLTSSARREMSENGEKTVYEKFYYKNWSKKISDFILNN